MDIATIIPQLIDSTPIGIYEYGSRVYGTSNENSDYDFVVITDKEGDWYHQYETEDVDIHFMSEDHYKTLLKQHDIMALECYFNPSPILRYFTDFELDLPTLRKVISGIASNSWVKGKKKISLEDEDDYIGLKSLFHSFRIPDYGIQIARFGEIKHFNEMNFIWKRLEDMKEQRFSLDEIIDELKPLHNKVMSEFRKLAPKD